MEDSAMFSKKINTSPSLLPTLLSTALALQAGCGKFGNKDNVAKLADFQTGTGCFDKIDGVFKRFTEGTSNAEEWSYLWTCVEDNINSFKKHVRSSSGDGSYNRDEIESLVNHLLLSNKQASPELIQSFLELKAYLLGGTSEKITNNDLDEFKKLQQIFKEEGLLLLPLLQERKNNPSDSNSLALMERLRLLGLRLSQSFNLNENGRFTKDQVNRFVIEFSKFVNVSPRYYFDHQSDLFLYKRLLTGGSESWIETSSFKTLITDGLVYAGAALMLNDKKEKDLKFFSDLLKRLQPTLEHTLDQNNGYLSYADSKKLLDKVDVSWLTEKRKAAIIKDLPQVYSKLFESKNPGFDKNSLNLTLRLFSEGVESQTHIENIFKLLGHTTVSPSEFEAQAARYVSTRQNQERESIMEIRRTAKNFIGLYPEDSSMISFGPETQSKHSRNNLIRLSWFRLAIKHLLNIYAQDPEKKKGTPDDLTALIKDYINIIYSFGKYHPTITIENVAKKRFREANLFMPNSNGDSFMDIDEGTYYLAFLFSSGALSSKIFDLANENCPLGALDVIELPTMNMECFRKNHFADQALDQLWIGFPDLKRTYSTMNSTGKKVMQQSIETAARRLGITNDPISQYDVDGYAAVPHYVEDLMARFDLNNDQALDTYEILTYAYPVFKQSLEELSGLHGDKKLQGLLTYIVKYGEIPSGTAGTLKFVMWLARRNSWNVYSGRGNIYKVVAIISKPPVRH